MSERDRAAQEAAELAEATIREADELLDEATRHVVKAISMYRAAGQRIREKFVLPEGPK